MLVDSPSNRQSRLDHIRSAEQKIKDVLKGIDMSPPTVLPSGDVEVSAVNVKDGGEGELDATRKARKLAKSIEAERLIPASEFQPWMAKYVANDQAAVIPSIFYGKYFKTASASSSSSTSSSNDYKSLLDRPTILPSDPKERARILAETRTKRVQGRVEGAKEDALDYKLERKRTGMSDAAGGSEAGGRRGGPSGMRAWANLVEDRIEVRNCLELAESLSWKLR